MYKIIAILYLVCFFCYNIVSRVPDYFEGEFVQGVILERSFSSNNNRPRLVVEYRVGSQRFIYKTNMWFLKKYVPKDQVTIIYNPSNPANASIYAFIGYWIKWPELLFTGAFFIVLFGAAVSITGPNREDVADNRQYLKKRKYDD